MQINFSLKFAARTQNFGSKDPDTPFTPTPVITRWEACSILQKLEPFVGFEILTSVVIKVAILNLLLCGK
jgi:hypothetical protein